MKNRKKLFRNEEGFTLVEIIAVLIILGILAVVAVPKYVDLQEEGRKKAAMSAISEIRGRCSIAYGQLLLKNNGDTSAFNVVSVMDLISTNLGADFVAGIAQDGVDAKITVTQVDGVNLDENVSAIWKMPE